MANIKVIAFDADDTLWINEPYFQETERKFCELLEDYLPHHTVSRELLQTEMANLRYYGYGVKSFMLSMIETAVSVSEKTIDIEVVEKILNLGKEMLEKPVELLDGVEDVLKGLHGSYRLVMATKGDLLHQEQKLIQSGLEPYFHHIEILSEKKEADYQKLIRHLDVQPQEFLMIGNSLKSDILPVINIGGYGFHVPYHTTWAFEKIDTHIDHPHFRQLNNIREVLEERRNGGTEKRRNGGTDKGGTWKTGFSVLHSSVHPFYILHFSVHPFYILHSSVFNRSNNPQP